jgi:ABC-type glycerol-3-phosphate transport system substrate-binding protein
MAPVPVTETDNSLTIWIPPAIAARSETGDTVLSNQLLAFGSSHPDLEIVVEQKTVDGQGGILSYLRTGRNVAPTVLPDLIVLPTNQLETVAAEQLIFPLGDLNDPDLLEDLYPAAQALVRHEGQLIGYPFALTNLTHLAYDSSAITTTLPATWEQFISDSSNNFVFPAAGQEGAILTLQLYLAAGGSLTNEADQPGLQVEPLTTALRQLSQGRNNGFILLQSSNLTTLNESWQLFQAGTATLAQTTAEQFLRQRTDDLALGYASIPGPEGRLTPLVNGWAWAVSTADPEREARAIELITTLASDPGWGEWSRQSGILPASRQAFSEWPQDDAYIEFIQAELTRSAPIPINVDGSVMVALSNAVFDVVSLSKSPEVAAEEAVAILQP